MYISGKGISIFYYRRAIFDLKRNKTLNFFGLNRFQILRNAHIFKTCYLRRDLSSHLFQIN